MVDKMQNLATTGDFCTILVLGTSSLDFKVATTDMWGRGLKVPKGAYEQEEFSKMDQFNHHWSHEKSTILCSGTEE